MSDEPEDAKAGPAADDAKRDEEATTDVPAEAGKRPDAATVPGTDAPVTDAPGTGEPAEDEPASEMAEDEPAAAPAEDEPAGETAEDEPAGEMAEDEPAGETAEDEPAGEVAPEDEIAELKDKLLRTLAENENMRRRARREREDTAKYAVASFARDMLGAADNLRRALDAIPEGSPGDDASPGALIEGVQLTERALLSVFERHGIRKIDPMGEKFDHDFHEAMFEVPTDDAEPGTVVQVVEVGYLIHDRLLRAAKVGIAKAPPDADEEHVLDTTV